MTKRLAIFGAGGHAREVLDVVDAINAVTPHSIQVDGFVSERESDWGQVLNDVPVVGGWAWLDEPAQRGIEVVCGIGSPAVRKRIMDRCARLGLRAATLVHPRATTTRWVSLREGCVVTAGVVLTNKISLGAHVHVNRNSTIGHDAILGDFCTVAPGVNVSGNVTVGEGCDLGTGAAIIQKLSIGAWSVVGAGAVVNKDLPANCTAVGVPAKVIKTREDGWWRAP